MDTDSARQLYYIGRAYIGDDILSLYSSAEGDVNDGSTKPEAGNGDAIPDLTRVFADDLPEVVPCHSSDLKTHIINFYSLREQILQALGGLMMSTIREAYRYASGAQDSTFQARASDRSSLAQMLGRVGACSGEILNLFRRLVFRGINSLSSMRRKLAEKRRIVRIKVITDMRGVLHMLDRMLLEAQQAALEETVNLMPPPLHYLSVIGKEATFSLDSGEAETRTNNVVPEELLDGTSKESKEKRCKVVYLNSVAPVELYAGLDGIMRSEITSQNTNTEVPSDDNDGVTQGSSNHGDEAASSWEEVVTDAGTGGGSEGGDSDWDRLEELAIF